ncbi:transposase domain-containing protein [Aggregatibacter actinomycetemcomitans]|uniref:transposase domain-containing protein n=1 Tax=Aggregatibacter actinomycetemcomitans TaxID=714 RepID=UPI00023FEF20|nr:transposase domain-containing protein [Aggregatibacter actinomycetemcomitans]EHK89852.1 transposase [Aggregatibacter actinomycetemcomitans RhAA1]KNE76945.1 DDE endonuclease [Aggregatibacter actinomycetemcomitans RhAA1]
MSGLSIKAYYSAAELVELKLKSLPTAHKNIIDKAKREGWKTQKRFGRGGGYEYAVKSMPEDVQAEIAVKTHQKSAVENSPVSVSADISVDAQLLWASYEKSTEKQQSKAQMKLRLMCAVAELVSADVKVMDALALVAEKHNQSNAKAVSVGSLKNWWYAVKDAERSLWLPLLVGYQTASGEHREAEFSADAWAFFRADYFRNERPQFGSCYERLKRAANANGWVIPSASSIKRKIEREVPKTHQVYLRKGEYAMSRMFPSMVRTVADMQAMEWVNGDGYKHNVWVEWHNGHIIRPKTWLWQDVRTRMILAYRCDESENTNMIRLALLDVVNKYGIPKHLTIDNTKAAANKKMTGGVKNRYRFKVREDEVMGIIPALGIQLHWTTVRYGRGRGQAKPIERAFSHGGLGELVDKHPSLAGYHAGDNALDKPDNYQGNKAGVDYDTFILALEEGIQMFNERMKRETEICRGELSFKQAFERDFALAEKRYATPEQMRYLLTLHEEVTLKDSGTFELKAGGKVNDLQNRYEAYELIGTGHKRVVVRYDPNNLHDAVWVYSLTGEYLAEAHCSADVAFDNTQAAQDYSRKEREFVRLTKKAAKAAQDMAIQEAARYLPEVEFEETEEAEAQMWEVIKDGTALRKVEAVPDDEEENEFEQTLQRGIAMLKKEKGL